MNYKIILTFLFTGITSIGFTQEDTNVSENTYNKNKGKAYFYWGGNRTKYSKSDIQFEGKNYNFTLQDVNAKDKPKVGILIISIQEE